MKSNEVRKLFLDFFENRGHKVFESSPVVPYDDPTLLFTNAGMNQFKKIFLGEVKTDLKRAVSSQKCIRVSGKHNDLEEVGKDGRHHTFFEMLGNWSFGDYYKEDAIKWAWEFVTEVVKLDKDRLYVSVYKDDDESYNIWKNIIGLDEKRIYKFGDIEKGDEENFWSMGETGPCGPCTEIFYDQGPEVKCKEKNPTVGSDCDRYLELWNLVFMEFNRDDKGKLTPLPFKSVDTGMGLERIVAVLQGVYSNYETDLFQPIMEKLEQISGKSYNDSRFKVPFQIIADHIRALTFAIADGALPSNEGRGYVLRRLLRRAARQSRKLEIKNEFLYLLIEPVVKKMGGYYKELEKHKSKIEQIIKEEEERFNKTLDKGLSIYFDIKNTLKKTSKKIIPGDKVFLLHDTYGFPLDLTKQMAEEDNLDVDEDGFYKLMKLQKERSRVLKTNIDFTNILGNDWSIKEKKVSTFTGYKSYSEVTQLISYKNIDQNRGLLFLDKTPFYAESGGQTSDKGILVFINEKDSNILNIEKFENLIFNFDLNSDYSGLDLLEEKKRKEIIVNEISRFFKEYNIEPIILFVNNVYKTKWGPLHDAEIIAGNLDDKAFDYSVYAIIDKVRRYNIMRNHTVTHLIHQALIDVLGDHVQQRGSYVGPNYMRFDFTHFTGISKEELERVENIVNKIIAKNLKVEVLEDVPLEDAKKLGAKALFEDKYSSKVRVVKIDNYSIELCGGTHSPDTSFIMGCKILKEEAVSAGIRRVEVITGQEFYKYLKNQNRLIENIKIAIKVKDSDIIEKKVKELIENNNKLKKEIENFKVKNLNSDFDNIIKNVKSNDQFNLYVKLFKNGDMKLLRDFADKIKAKDQKAIIVFANIKSGKAQTLCVVSKEISEKYSAKDILQKITFSAKGSCGGRDDFAQGGAKDIDKLKTIFSSDYIMKNI